MPDTSNVPSPSDYHQVLDEVRHLMDVPLKVTVELGRRTMSVRELLNLKVDSVVELPKSAGENIDVHVNGTPVAYGEVLEMEGRTGIRLTDLHIRS